MIIVVHHSKAFDFEPLPSDVEATEADFASGKVRRDLHGNIRMRVVKDLETHTGIQLGEHQIIAKIIHEKTRPEGGKTLSRREAVAQYLSEHFESKGQRHGHFKRGWLTGKIEIHDDGPDEALFRAMLQEHVAAENIDASDIDLHVEKYLEPAVPDDHAKHLCAHFGVKVKS